ncbi:MAG: rod shape-determining protein [Clostridiales bacterium]|nr:rod shape-determining protein [Clostridiales bacterium]
MSFFKQNLAIDLGTSTFYVSIEKKGIVIRVPAIVAVREGTGQVLAIGENAMEMAEEAPLDISIIKPMKNGVISNCTAIEKMISYYMQKAIRNPFKRMLAPDVMISVPSKITGVEKRAVEQSAYNAGAGRIFLIEDAMAAAIGAGIDVSGPIGQMIIDIGGGTTDIAVISYNGIVVSNSVKIAGDTYNESIINFLRKKFDILISEKMAEDVKINVGSVYRDSRKSSMVVKGRDANTGLPKEVEICTDDFLDILLEDSILILEGIHNVLEETPPELSADIYSAGLLMTGGGALLDGLNILINKSTGIKVTIAENPQDCVVNGAIKTLCDMTQSEKKIIGKINRTGRR